MIKFKDLKESSLVDLQLGKAYKEHFKFWQKCQVKCVSFAECLLCLVIGLGVLGLAGTISKAEDFITPWKDKSKALLLDAYELNALDWPQIVKDKRIVGFIGKASDGLIPKYCGRTDELCNLKWRKYSIAKELYHTRRYLAKAHGLLWGTYHLARADNPIEQAQHFLNYAKPEKDELIVLDIEAHDDEEFMSLEDAEIFVTFLHEKIGRYPLLYTNHRAVKFIAANRIDYPILSRLKLWYARYLDDISKVFPIGNWDQYTLWQFAYGGNCNKKKCPYRVEGTPYDIDVNVSTLTTSQLRAAWPLGGLEDENLDPMIEAILEANKVEFPEEEKHSEF